MILAALIALYGTLAGRRLNRIDQRLDRFEDHLERQDGSFLAVRQGISSDIATVGARIDRLYELLVAERRGPDFASEADPRPEAQRLLRRSR